MSDRTIQLYFSSVTGNSNLKKHQQRIEDVLSSRNVTFDKIDISDSLNEQQKQFMREYARPSSDGKTPLPPQLFADKEYLGDYEMFLEALENELLDEFLKLVAETKASLASVSLTKEDEKKMKADENENESKDKDKTIEEVAKEDARKIQAEKKLEEDEKQTSKILIIKSWIK